MVREAKQKQGKGSKNNLHRFGSFGFLLLLLFLLLFFFYFLLRGVGIEIGSCKIALIRLFKYFLNL
jgi:hypothetical protein